MDLQTIAPSPPELESLHPQMCQRRCGSRALARGLCRACYYYLARTGVDRPEHLIVRSGERMLAKRWSL